MDVLHAKAELETGTANGGEAVSQPNWSSVDNKTGKLGGWIMARIFLGEAQNLSMAYTQQGEDTVQVGGPADRFGTICQRPQMQRLLRCEHGSHRR